MWSKTKVPNRSSKRVKRMGKAVSQSTPSSMGAMMASVPDLGHGRLPLNCQVVLRPEQTKGFVLLKKALGRRAHVRLADGVRAGG